MVAFEGSGGWAKASAEIQAAWPEVCSSRHNHLTRLLSDQMLEVKFRRLDSDLS
jgi:hypothetical protein